MSAQSAIDIEHTARVRCGNCGHRWSITWQHLGGKLMAERQLRRDGWCFTVARGWICEACAARRRKQVDGTVIES